MLVSGVLGLVLAVGPRWAYEAAYDNVADGDWYAGMDNETATLAWGESYVMMSIAAMYRATGHPMYLDRLARHLDALLEQRDDNRGVADYRGVSGACWRNVSYQPEPYCYVVHTGMLIYPMAEFAALVADSSFADELAYDGESFGDKADAYVAEAEASVAFHDDQWNAAGYYVFRPDADFMTYPGVDLPLNQSNAMGRALVVLAELTGDAEYRAKATGLAQRFRDQVTVAGDGTYLWNYWGGPLSGNGEDVSHAAINVDFAALAAEHGYASWSAADVLGMARTFTERVYIDDGTISDFMGGGSVNGSGYRPQVGRWLRTADARTAVYTAIRDLYEQDYPASATGSGSILLGWALLAEHEPLHCSPFFYVVDWNDLGDTQQATAYGANILTEPHALDTGCIVPVQADIPRNTVVQQWDGAAYHRVAQWGPSGGMVTRFVPYEPTWPFVYYEDGVLFQFDDAFVAGQGIEVAEHPGFDAPAITSAPPDTAELDVQLDYALTGTFEGPHWWRLADGPGSARLDPDTGALAWTPTAGGDYTFVVHLELDYGVAEQTFVVNVAGAGTGTSGAESSGSESGDTPTTGASTDGENTGPSSGDATGDSAGPTAPDSDPTQTSGADSQGARGDDTSGCGCTTTQPPTGVGVWWLLLAFARRRRHAAPAHRC